jgi:hypothetical protein
MTRQEAIQRILERTRPIESGQSVEIELLRPEDAWKLARLFYEVYGDGYPMDLYYVPELLLAEIESGRLHCVVARAKNGDIVGHMGLYRCAPSPLLYESGVGLVAQSYRFFSNLVYRLSAQNGFRSLSARTGGFAQGRIETRGNRVSLGRCDQDTRCVSIAPWH